MNTRYWIRITVTMLIIFVVGAVAATAFNRGKDLFARKFPSYAALMASGFRINGSRLGDIQRVQFLRSTPGLFDSAVVTVRLNDSSAQESLRGCHLVVRHAAPFNGSTRFSCVDSSDSTHLALVPFGHVVVEPAGTTLPLYIPAASLGEVRATSVRGIFVGDSGDVDVDASRGRVSVVVNGHEIFRAGGDSDGGSLVVRAPNGQPLVQISGDSTHGSVKIMDADGKTRVDIHSPPARPDSGH